MNNSNLIVMTAATAKPGKEQVVRRALLDVATAARAQKGCIAYRILQTTEDVATTLNYEEWSSVEERDAFLAGPDVKQFIAAVSGGFTEAPQPASYREIG